MPLALRSVQYKPVGTSALSWWNLPGYGVGGIIAPIICFNLIDTIITGPHSA